MTDWHKEKEALKALSPYGFPELLRIMALLRSDEGCPWDRAQDHKSIRKNLLEETYEAAEAIDTEDSVLLREELGDVLLQVVFHSRISEEAGGFSIDDVVDELCKKLVFRHPHVFEQQTVSDDEEALTSWNAAKAESKQQKSVTEQLESVSKALPALMRAEKLGKKAGGVGFDFASASDALDKVNEEVAEVAQALMAGDKQQVSEEIGDLLLAVSCVARLAGVDPEESLQVANDKFIHRFSLVEQQAKIDGKSLENASEVEKNTFWEQAKRKNRL